MKKQKIILVALLVALLISTGAFQNIMAADSQSQLLADDTSVLRIVNNSYVDVTVKLISGPDAPRDITVPAGTSDDSELTDGTYKYEYQYCDWGGPSDDKITGEIDLNDKDYKMILYPCSHQPIKMLIMNHLAEDVKLGLFGYEEYSVDIEPGKNKVELFSGEYIYDYDACGLDFTGEVKVLKNGSTTLILHSCEWFTHPARIHGQPNPVKFRIINHASFSLILTLIGPENYLVTASPGVNFYTIVAGSYKYSYYLDYALHTGTMLVTKNGIGALVLSPSYLFENFDETEAE
ncbi:MAG: hypothetical protein ABIG63_18080 [Chloroflexota bacterium]